MKKVLNTVERRLTASLLKDEISSFLMKRDCDGVIGLEVMYGSSRRVADMVFISKGHSYAIEIKSEYDTTVRLRGQLEEYLSLFDYVIIFSAPNHIRKIEEILPSNVGLYSISANGIVKIRHEKINRHARKSEMLNSIPSARVKFDFSVRGKLTSDEIRATALKHSQKRIHEYFINYFKSKLLLSTHHKVTKPHVFESSELEDYIIV